MKKEEQLVELCREALETELSNEATLRIQTALQEELKQLEETPSAPREVMTIDETADYLRLTLE